MKDYQRTRRAKKKAPGEEQPFDHLSPEERKVVGNPEDYDWAKAVQAMSQKDRDAWLRKMNRGRE